MIETCFAKVLVEGQVTVYPWDVAVVVYYDIVEAYSNAGYKVTASDDGDETGNTRFTILQKRSQPSITVTVQYDRLVQ